MTREEAKQLLPIIQVFAEGEIIECRTKPGTISAGIPNKWTEIKEIGFWNGIEYRIKLKPNYRPFANAEECWNEMQKHQPFGWLKGGKCFYNIVSVSNIDVSMANVSGDIVTLDFIDVMEDKTFADGTPFGVKIEEDYNGIK
ncbi:hypothetical protein JQM97_03520 [Prevotella hominis]|uniref:hypothetical protein n=1 Tax=Segatella hominis TaxID=2518605 RepID=UPI001F2D5609|nr:hypothetical protein [Segatella hominis]MCF2590028.1 hypothetical protein [Segatella hominis]